MLDKANPKHSRLLEHILSTKHKENCLSAGIAFKETNQALCMSVDPDCNSQPSSSVHNTFVPVVEQEVKLKINNAIPIYTPLPSAADNRDNGLTCPVILCQCVVPTDFIADQPSYIYSPGEADCLNLSVKRQ